MSDGALVHRPHDSLSVVLNDAMAQSGATLGMLVELLVNGRVKVWAHQSLSYLSPSASHPGVSRSVSYEPHPLPDTTIGAKLTSLRGQLRPKILSLPEGLPRALATFYQVDEDPSKINSLLVMPSGNADFMLVLFGSTPWKSPPVAEISADLDRAVAEFLRNQHGAKPGSVTELILALGEAIADLSESSAAIVSICKQLGNFLGFETSAAFSVEDDRLLPIAVCRLAARHGREPDLVEASMTTGVFPAAQRAFDLAKPVSTTSQGESKLPADISLALGLSEPSLLLPILRSRRPVGLFLLGNPSGTRAEVLNDPAAAQLLISHLSLLFIQVIDEEERALRAQAWRGIQPMLDTAIQVASASELAEFFSRSLAISLGLKSAFFALVGKDHTISGTRTFGMPSDRSAALDQALSEYDITQLPDFESLKIRHTQIFVEPSGEGRYDPLLDRVFSNQPYLLVPIVTSAGLMGFGAGAQSRPRPYWNQRERGVAADWSLSATLVADNISLRLAEKEHLETYREKAFKDSLTGLPNRELFHDRLSVATVKAHRTQNLTSIIFIDVDFFKQVNDRFGHMAGDELLVQIARRLTTSFRDTDTVARLSGDEFVVLVENSPHEAEIVEIAKRAFDRLNDTYTIGSFQLDATISMGLAIGSPGTSGTALLERADQAMYRSKEAGRARMTVYADSERTDDGTLDLSAIERRATAPKESGGHEPPQIHESHLRFSLDYVDFARLRTRINEGTGSHQNPSPTTQLQAEGADAGALEELGAITLELIRPDLGGSDFDAGKPPAFAILEQLLASKRLFLALAPAMSFKILLDLAGVTAADLSNLARLLSRYQAELASAHSLVMSISAQSLGEQPALLSDLSSLAVRFQAEIMITSIEERTIRLYDLLMPMVTYLSIDAQEALTHTQSTVPNSLSALSAIARDRGIRLCAQGVADETAISQLVLAGVTVMSGPAVELRSAALFKQTTSSDL